MDTALKLLGTDGRVGGYLVVWGSPQQRDLQGEYFTPETDLAIEWYAQRPVLYHHGLDGTLKGSIIGTIDTLRPDDTGLWAEAQLDLRKRYVRTVLQLVERGILGWSSGSLPHLVEVADDGHIKKWPLVEGSLTPSPAEPRKTDVRTIKNYALTIKTAYSLLGQDTAQLGLPEGLPDADMSMPEEPSAEEVEALIVGANPETKPSIKAEEPMNIREILNGLLRVMMQSRPDLTLSEDEINTIIANAEQQLAPQQEAMASMSPAALANTAAPVLGKAFTTFVEVRRANQEANEAAINAAALKFMQTAPPSQSNQLPGFSGAGLNNSDSGSGVGAPAHIRDLKLRGKYANLSPETMSFIADTYGQYRLKTGQGRFLPGGKLEGVTTFMQELADKAASGYEKGHFFLEEPAAKAVKSILGVKANELDHTAQANYGQEWVHTIWRDQIWEKARLENVVLSQFESMEMAASIEELPLESADPDVYYTPEDTDDAHLDLSASLTPASKIGTGKKQFSAKKLSLRTGWSAEEDEDSIVRFAEQARRQADRAMRNAIDFNLLCGDTETGTTNINLDGAAPAAKTKYLAFDGLFKMALVTGTGLKVDAGNAAATLAAIRQTRFKMGRELAPNTNEIVLFTHTEGYSPLLGLDEFLTMDKVGALATALKGQLGVIDGMPVLVTAQILMSASNGKVSNTANNNTKARYLVVYKPNWKVGFRRKITANLFQTQTGEAWQLYMSTRLDFKSSTTDSVATLYNAAA